MAVTWLVENPDCTACPSPIEQSYKKHIVNDRVNGDLTGSTVDHKTLFTTQCPFGTTTKVEIDAGFEYNYVTQEPYTVKQTFMSMYYVTIDGERYTSERQTFRDKRLFSTVLSVSSGKTQTAYSGSTTRDGSGWVQGYFSTTEFPQNQYNPNRVETSDGGTTSCPRYSTTQEDGKDTTTILTDSENEEVLTWSKCPEYFTEAGYETVMRQYPTNFTRKYGCFATAEIVGNPSDESCISVFVRPEAKDSEYGLLRDLLATTPLSANETFSTIREKPPNVMLDEAAFLKGGYTVFENISTSAHWAVELGFDATTYRKQMVRTHAPFTSTRDDYYDDAADSTETFPRISNTTSRTVEVDLVGEPDVTSIEHTVLTQSELESVITHRTVDFNTEMVEIVLDNGDVVTVKAAGTASYAAPDDWGFEAATVPHIIEAYGKQHQLFDMAEPTDDAEGKKMKTESVNGVRYNNDGGLDETMSWVVNGLKGIYTYRTENGSVITDAVTVSYEMAGGATTKIDGSPYNCFQRFGSAITRKPWDKNRFVHGSPRYIMYEASTLAYPAYQDIYDVGTGGMLYSNLNAEFNSTLYGAQSATANSALVRQSAISVTEEFSTNDGIETRTVIKIESPKDSFLVTPEDEQSDIDKIINYQTAITNVFFSQKSYTATRYTAVETVSNTVDEGTVFNIIRGGGEEYEGENYEREDGGCVIHTFFNTLGLDEYGIGALGGVLQNGSPRSVTLQVINNGLPMALRTTKYGGGCSFSTGSVILDEGLYTFVGTAITMFATDQVWNVGMLRSLMSGGTTMRDSEYYQFKPVKLT